MSVLLLALIAFTFERLDFFYVIVGPTVVIRLVVRIIIFPSIFQFNRFDKGANLFWELAGVNMLGLGSTGRGLETVLGKFHVVESEEIEWCWFVMQDLLCWIIVAVISSRDIAIIAGKQELYNFLDEIYFLLLSICFHFSKSEFLVAAVLFYFAGI